jgi:hypothetical protein
VEEIAGLEIKVERLAVGAGGEDTRVGFALRDLRGGVREGGEEREREAGNAHDRFLTRLVRLAASGQV